jgi:hypothetical protein
VEHRSNSRSAIRGLSLASLQSRRCAGWRRLWRGHAEFEDGVVREGDDAIRADKRANYFERYEDVAGNIHGRGQSVRWASVT